MDALLDPVIRANRGFFTRRQALDVGLLDRDLVRGVRSGRLVRLRQGAYAPASEFVAQTETERHVLMVRAVQKAQQTPVAICGVSAAAVHGLTLHGVDLSMVHVVRLGATTGRREAGVNHHVRAGGLTDHLVEIDGVLVTDLARTVWDLARWVGVDSGVVAADSALHRDPSIATELRRLARRLAHQPHARQAWYALGLADGRAESAGESLQRLIFCRYNLPTPELQYEVFDGDGVLVGTTDFGWPEYRHLGEFDGKIKYGALLRPGESATDVVFREKKREDAMRRLRHGMSRFTWSSMAPAHQAREMRQLSADLLQSHRLYVR